MRKKAQGKKKGGKLSKHTKNKIYIAPKLTHESLHITTPEPEWGSLLVSIW